MKKKFETNVAVDIPKTKSQEPGLPWRLSSEEVEKIESRNEEYKSTAASTPPLKTRAIFLILLILTIFVIAFYMITNTVMGNESIRVNMSKNELAITSLRADMAKIAGEKNMLSEKSSQLEKKINDLTAQKELFTSVIETMTKKGEEPDTDKRSALNGPGQ